MMTFTLSSKERDAREMHHVGTSKFLDFTCSFASYHKQTRVVPVFLCFDCCCERCADSLVEYCMSA
jgi:hypothetical protein